MAAAPTTTGFEPTPTTDPLILQKNPYAGMTPAQQAAAMGMPLPTVPAGLDPGTLKYTDLTPFVKGLQGLQGTTIPPIDTAGIARTASQYAGQDIDSVVRALRLQQTQGIQAGQRAAGLINQAGRAGARLTSPWAGQLGQTFTGYANQLLNFAGGYSGATRDAALAEAQGIRNQLQAINDPQNPGTAQAYALDNTLRALGASGANALASQAIAAQYGAQGIPREMLGYAQNLAAGTMGAALQEARKITPQIALEEAKRPAVTRDYIQTLTQTAQAARDFDLRALQTRADIFGSEAQIAAAGNESKLNYAKYVTDTQTNRANIIQAVNTYNTTMSGIRETYRANMDSARLEGMNYSETVRHNQATEANANRQANIAAKTLAASISQANAAQATADRNAANQEANTRGYYLDANNVPHANPGYKLVYDKKTGAFQGAKVDLGQTVTGTRSAASWLNATFAEQRAQGFRVVGKGKNVQVYPYPNKRLVYIDSKGNLTFKNLGVDHFAGYAVDKGQTPYGQPIAKPGTTGKGGGITVNNLKDLQQEMHVWHTGQAGVNTRTGQPILAPSEALNWNQAYQKALARLAGKPGGKKKALDVTLAEYGSPMTLAINAAQTGKDGGVGLTEAVQHTLEAINAGNLPVPIMYALAGLAQVYGYKLSDVQLIFRQLQNYSSGRRLDLPPGGGTTTTAAASPARAALPSTGQWVPGPAQPWQPGAATPWTPGG